MEDDAPPSSAAGSGAGSPKSAFTPSARPTPRPTASRRVAAVRARRPTGRGPLRCRHVVSSGAVDGSGRPSGAGIASRIAKAYHRLFGRPM